MYELDFTKWLIKALTVVAMYALAITVLPYSVGRYITQQKYDACQALKKNTGTEMFYSVRVDDCFSVVRDQVYDPQIFIRANSMKENTNVREEE